MKPSSELLSPYFVDRFGAEPESLRVMPLGRGSHGQGFRVSFTAMGREERVIVKTLDGRGLGHDYASDRASVLLQARSAYGRLPRHVKALDVLALVEGGRVLPVEDGREYYLVMEEAEGVNYFDDLVKIGERGSLDGGDRKKISLMASYLGRIHSKKKDAPELYLRKIRDTIGHGECLMGVLDTYNGATFTDLDELACIEKECVDWRTRLKPLTSRLSVTHGDFHPGNILFSSDRSFKLLDRSRGEYGEPADDLTALTINYILYSMIRYGKMACGYDEAIRIFFEEYVGASADARVKDVCAPFFAFRGVVVANPLFYPDLTEEVRNSIFCFIHGVLKADSFRPEDVNKYISRGRKIRERFKK